MPRILSPQAAAALRAQVAFLRDLGIYDFYRHPVDATGYASSASSASATHVVVNTEPAATATSHSVPAVTVLPEPPHQVPATTPSSAPRDEAPGNQGREVNEPRPQPTPHTPEPDPSPEDHEIAARKRALPNPLPAVFPGIEIPSAGRPAALQNIRDIIGDCTRCPLAFAGRNTIVFGDGDPNARLLFVGEGPGADEDASGIPFIGKAGQLLNNMITAMGLRREDVYIANIVKCRPPANRVPEPEEANTCSPFLLEQIGVIRPDVIVALGSTAATYLLGAKSPLSALRGRVHPALGTRLIVTYHPAYLLRDPRQKKEAWADLQIAMRELTTPSR